VDVTAVPAGEDLGGLGDVADKGVQAGTVPGLVLVQDRRPAVLHLDEQVIDGFRVRMAPLAR
jgi:hypothetical protein